ncbi:MAG TPA: AAA family ATPase, partial [Thermomicrobiales bacterium]|nr:AAA family ATPase [Thermomicrobiales bacterium]
MSTNATSTTSSQPGSVSIVGRSREQRILHERLMAAIGGHGSLVLVAGEAGIGKTALTEWLADLARRHGADVLRGNCYDLTLTPPYGPWLDALADLASDSPQRTRGQPLALDVAAGSVTSQAVLFEQAEASLADAAAVRPLVLVLEDLHWSDPASLDLLRFLARSIDRSGILLIATYRANEIRARDPLFRLLPLLIREGHAERLDLRALGEGDVQAFVRQRYILTARDESRLISYLQRRTEGNPFYLSEVLRTLEVERLLQPAEDRWLVGELNRTPLPPLIRRIVEGRLAQLDEDTRWLLEVAAVIGQEVPLDIWMATSGADRERIGTAVERGIEASLLVELAAVGVGFAHALVRETLYQQLVLPRRQRLHSRVAGLLLQRSDPPFSAVAAHFGLAGDPRAIDWLVRAGQHALKMYAADDVVTAINRAQEMAGRFTCELPATAYRTRAAALVMLGKFDEARRDYSTVLERARASKDRHAEWQALIDLGMLWAERDFEQTGTFYRAALALARATGDDATVAYSLNRIANLHVNQDDPDAAIPLHQEALAIFEASGDRQGIAGALDFLGMASFLTGDWSASMQYFERAIGRLRELGDQQRLASSLISIIGCGGTLGRKISTPVFREPAFWLRSGEEGLALSRKIGWSAIESFGLISLSGIAGVRGDLGRALRDAEAGLAI